MPSSGYGPTMREESGSGDANGGWHLAQFNIARMRFPIDSAEMAEFVAGLDPINSLGERSPGFVWRHVDDSGASIDTRVFGDEDLLINLTVWESVEALWDYAYRTAHTDFLRRRRDWFEPVGSHPSNVLWWIPAGSIPILEEATGRLERLRDHGPGVEAFTFGDRFDPPR